MPVGGFVTRELRIDGRREGFMVEAAARARAVLVHVRLPGPPRVGRYGVDLAVFERVALAAVQALLPLLRASGRGRVVKVSSEGGSLAGMGRHSPPTTSLGPPSNALARMLAVELRRFWVLPGPLVRLDGEGRRASRRPSWVSV